MCSCITGQQQVDSQDLLFKFVGIFIHWLILQSRDRRNITFREPPWAPPPPCPQFQSSSFIQNIIRSGQILRLAFEHAFNLPLRSFQSLSDECRDFLLVPGPFGTLPQAVMERRKTEQGERLKVKDRHDTALSRQN